MHRRRLRRCHQDVQLPRQAGRLPGDNEWTDCHRKNNGGYDNLERLDHIGKTMFADSQSFGATKIPRDHRRKSGEKFVGNTRFIHEGIAFVGSRLETFGSPNVRWVKVGVDPGSREVFTIHPMIVKGN